MPAQNQDTPRKNLAVNADSREFSSAFRGSGAEDTVMGVWAVYVYGNLVRWLGHLRTVSAEVFTDCLHTRITVGRRAPAALGCPPFPQLDESPRTLLLYKQAPVDPGSQFSQWPELCPKSVTLQLEAKLEMGKNVLLSWGLVSLTFQKTEKFQNFKRQQRRLFLYVGPTTKCRCS